MLQVCADGSAAVGICWRPGIGRSRRLAVGQPWAQERVRPGGLNLPKWPGERNPVDILAKG
eukprot:4259970-Alexandrium_andersonii.AAC.1